MQKTLPSTLRPKAGHMLAARIVVLATCCLSLAPLPAQASFFDDDTEVNGSADLTAASGGQIAVAIGEAVFATNDAAVVTSGSHVRSVDLSAITGAQIALSLGVADRAHTIVGSVNGDAGDVSAHGVAGTAIALSVLPGNNTCVSVASVGGGAGNVSVAGGVGTAVAYDFWLWRHPKIRVATVGDPC